MLTPRDHARLEASPSTLLAFALLLFACQPAEEPTAPTGNDRPARVSSRVGADQVLALATPPGMRRYREHARQAVSRAPTAISQQLYLSLAVSISDPTDLGSSFENTDSYGNGINASGQIAGWTLSRADGPQVIHAIRWEANGAPVQLPAATLDGQAVAKDVNDAGVVVGLDGELDPQLGPGIHAVRWGADGSLSELPRVESAGEHVAEGINNSGVTVGWALFPPLDEARALRWDEQGVHVLPGNHGVAYDVNDAGTAVGYVETPGLRPARWSPDGTLTVLSLPEGSTFGFAMGVNNLGQVVGTAGSTNGPEETRHAVIWEADGTPSLIPNPENAEAVKINDAGIVVGYIEDLSFGASRTRGVIWFEGERLIVPPDLPGQALVYDLSNTQLTGAAGAGSGAVIHAARWSFTVPAVHFDFSGFFKPVSNPGPTAPYVMNTVQAGQAVPIRFSLGGNQGLNIFAAGNPASKPVACTLSNTQGAEPTRAAGNTELSYHAGSDRYRYLWKTEKAWSGTCRQLSLTLVDGSTHLALFQFR
jgi:uncharacterized membrane protein